MRIKSSERFGEREATVGKEHREKKKFEKNLKSDMAGRMKKKRDGCERLKKTEHVEL